MLAKKDFQIDMNLLNEGEKAMCLMLHYDIWQSAGGFNSLEESIVAIGRNKTLNEEIIQVINILIDRIDFIEGEVELPYSQPLKLHSRYTRDQIFAAFGFSTFNRKSSNREGVAENKVLNTELLFIDLIKSEKDFSPSTLYDDYALSESIFHWQSQNATSSKKGKGLSYIKHQSKGKNILLFVRERNKDEYNNTMAYVFLGAGRFIKSYGSKPMNIEWELKEPMPPYLWKYSAKMAVG